MKTLKLILISFFFLGIFVLNSNGQDNSNPAEQGWFEAEYYSPIFCDGKMVDFLKGGTITVHYVKRYVPDVVYREIDQIKGKVTSSVTDEVFQIHETDKYLGTPGSYELTWSFNLKGNKGTHYNGFITMNLLTGKIIDLKTVCH